MSTIATRLIEAREEKGLTQKDLAEQSGVSQTTISHIESGRNSGSKHLPVLAKSCAVNTDWLATGEGPKYPGIAEPSQGYNTDEDLLSAVERLGKKASDGAKSKAISALAQYLVDSGIDIGEKRKD